MVERVVLLPDVADANDLRGDKSTGDYCDGCDDDDDDDDAADYYQTMVLSAGLM